MVTDESLTVDKMILTVRHALVLLLINFRAKVVSQLKRGYFLRLMIHCEQIVPV